ncbi:MAG: hypothetical protein IMF17_06250 [Proteobacteria bacterium]|nr:hypothetical protein [Pseudomonadota bacterium]
MNDAPENNGFEINPSDINNSKNSTAVAKVIYILFIISTIIGITGIIGAVMAYVNNDATGDDNEHWLQSHYRFQIRTFWIGLLYIFIGVSLSLFMIGYLILAFTFFWIIIRCAKGLKQLANKQPVNNLESWLFT